MLDEGSRNGHQKQRQNGVVGVEIVGIKCALKERGAVAKSTSMEQVAKT